MFGFFFAEVDFSPVVALQDQNGSCSTGIPMMANDQAEVKAALFQLISPEAIGKRELWCVSEIIRPLVAVLVLTSNLHHASECVPKVELQ